jgi:rRNA maturation endonuclease Nob1
MPQKPKMLCPVCGVEMNQHAVKIDYSIEDPALIDPAFGGALEEAHTCPQCGRTETRSELKTPSPL